MQENAMRRGSTARSSNPLGSRGDPLLLRVVVMVDEATEPALPESEAATRRAELVTMANSSVGPGLSAAGSNIAFAIRKRLKSDDAAAVVNTLKLLDELMRTCPYFYRYIADDKMFRRLWRFVVPDYKNGMRSMIPFGGKGKTAIDLRGTAGRPEIALKVLILIRAWAEELSVMYNGKFDPAAGFLIERYNSKRVRIKFPEVPVTGLPWVCPIGPSAHMNSAFAHSAAGDPVAGSSSGARARNGGPGQLPESLSLAEVENTVNLFENMVDNATAVRVLRTDVIKDLAARCRLIFENIDRLSMSMSKEEELSRAIKTSEKLSRALKAYDTSLQTGEITKPAHVVDSSALDSEDEGYDAHRYESSTYHSATRSDRSNEFSARDSSGVSSRRVPLGRPSISDAPSSRFRPLDRSRSHDSHLNLSGKNRFANERDRENSDLAEDRDAREIREAEQRRFHREYVASKRGLKAAASSSVDVRDRSRSVASSSERKKSSDDLKKNQSRAKQREKKEHDSEDSNAEDMVEPTKKSVENAKKKKRELKKSQSISVASSSISAAKPQRRTKDRSSKGHGSSSNKKMGRSASAAPHGSNTLVDVDTPGSQSVDSDSSIDTAKKGDTFAVLGERYGTTKSKSSSDTTEEVSAETDQALQQISGGMQGLGLDPQQAMAMYQTAQSGGMPAGLPYGSVVMMPGPMGMANPLGMANAMAAMSMYGSVNPMLQQNPAAMYSAYNTINPAMYYNSVNPLAYASQNPALSMGAPMGNPFLQQSQQMQQPPQMQQPQHIHHPQQMQQPQQAFQPQQQVPQSTSQATQALPQMQNVSRGFPSPDLSSQSFSGPGQANLAPFPPLPQTDMRMAQVQPAPPAPPMYTTVTNAPAPPPTSAPPQQPYDQMQPMPAALAYQSVNMATMPQFPQPGQQQVGQAAAYQATMANAAAVYQAAAAAYQSVQGQAPLQPQVVPVSSSAQHSVQMQPHDMAAAQQQSTQQSQNDTRPAQQRGG